MTKRRARRKCINNDTAMMTMPFGRWSMVSVMAGHNARPKTAPDSPKVTAAEIHCTMLMGTSHTRLAGMYRVKL